MKKKLLSVLLAAVGICACSFGISACKKREADKNEPEYTYATVYAQAQDLGYSGTLEEFIQMISGKDGEDGTSPHIGANGNWFVGEADTGVKATGANGKDGESVKSARVEQDGRLILVLTDGSEIDCGAVIEKHNHEYGDWITVNQATCTAVGLQLKICNTCENAAAKIIPMVEHTWGAWQEDSASDYHTHKCLVCEQTESMEHTGANSDYVCDDCGKILDGLIVAPVQGEIITRHEFGPDPSMDGMYHFHTGIDISAAVGTEVIAANNGTVESIVVNDNLKGNTITIAHAYGIKTVYSYVDINPELSVGDTVTRWQAIGTVATPTGSEYKLAAHVHFEIIQNGESVDPEDYIDFNL